MADPLSIACDLCPNEIDKRKDLIFAAAPRQKAHICEECVKLAVELIARRKAEEQGK